MILPAILGIIFGLLGWKFVPILWEYVRMRAMINRQKIKGPKDKFFIGNILEFEEDSSKFHQQLLNYSTQYQKEKIFRMWIGPELNIVCHHPDSVEKILSSNVLINKGAVYYYMQPWLGRGLLTSRGDNWRRKRKLLTPAFHFKILLDFVPIINKTARSLVKVIDQEGNQIVDFYHVIAMATLDAISETAMGVPIGAQQQNDSDYVKAILQLSENFMTRNKNPLLFNDFMFSLSKTGRNNSKCLKIVHDYTTKVIQERKRCLIKENAKKTNLEEEETKKRKLAFLDLLLEYQEDSRANNERFAMSDLDVREEVDTFMFEGHDTTATAITWATYLLAKYENEQKKVQEELDTIFEDDPEREISNEDIHKMTYLDQVIKETLRLYPSVPFIGRKVEKEMDDLCGYRIPKGANIMVFLAALHLREDIYPDPHTFKPERFDPSNSKDRNPYNYVPFAAGPRNCIGAKFANIELKIFLASIFRKFEAKTEVKEEDLAPAPEMVLRPSKPVNIRFSRR